MHDICNEANAKTTFVQLWYAKATTHILYLSSMNILQRNINYPRLIVFNIFFLSLIYLQLSVPGPHNKGLISLCLLFLIVYNYFQCFHKKVMRIHGRTLYVYSFPRKYKIHIDSIRSVDLNHRLINRLLDINTVRIHFINGGSRKIYVPEFDRDKAEQFIKENIIYQ